MNTLVCALAGERAINIIGEVDQRSIWPDEKHLCAGHGVSSRGPFRGLLGHNATYEDLPEEIVILARRTRTRTTLERNGHSIKRKRSSLSNKRLGIIGAERIAVYY